MAERDGQHEGVAADRLVRDVAEVGFERDEGGVEVAGVEPGGQDRRLLLGPLDAEAVVLPPEHRRDLGQQVRRDRRDDAQAERAGERVGETGGGLGEVVGLTEAGRRRAPGAPRRRASAARGVSCARTADAEGVLELRELRESDGCDTAHSDAGLPEAPRLGDGQRVLELAKR
jgi:hypothetical protein